MVQPLVVVVHFVIDLVQVVVVYWLLVIKALALVWHLHHNSYDLKITHLHHLLFLNLDQHVMVTKKQVSVDLVNHVDSVMM